MFSLLATELLPVNSLIRITMITMSIVYTVASELAALRSISAKGPCLKKLTIYYNLLFDHGERREQKGRRGEAK